MQEENLKILIDKRIKEVVPKILQSSAFVDRKLTDTPVDKNQVTPMGYVNLHGTTAERPASPSLGQQYFDTTLGYPVFWNGSSWVSGGSSSQTDSTDTTFTFNGTGSPGTSGSVTLSYQKIGNWVTLFVPGVTATSGTNSSQFNADTAIDVSFRPTSAQLGLIPIITDNGGAVLQPGLYVLGTNGILSIRRDSAGNNFTDATTCGSADGFSITYYTA